MLRDWIKWDGEDGDPFIESTFLEVRLRNGEILYDWSDFLDWEHLNHEEDIMEYKIFENKPTLVDARIERLEEELKELKNKLQIYN